MRYKKSKKKNKRSKKIQIGQIEYTGQEFGLNLNNGKIQAEEVSVPDPVTQKKVRRIMNLQQTPLDVYLQRGSLSAELAEAGNKLRRDFLRAGKNPYFTVDLTRPIGAGGRAELELTESMVGAMQRYRAALAALGSGLRDIVFGVCCLDQWAKEAMIKSSLRQYNFSDREGVTILRIGLIGLREWYVGGGR